MIEKLCAKASTLVQYQQLPNKGGWLRLRTMTFCLNKSLISSLINLGES